MSGTNQANPRETFDAEDQRIIIIRMLEQAKSTANLEIQQLIALSQKYLIALSQKYLNDKFKTNTMKQVVIIANSLIAKLEHIEEAKPTLNFLREKGLYRMLYRYPKFKGEQLPEDDILNALLRNGFIGVGISTLLIAAFVAVMLVGAPLWVVAISSGLFVGSSVYLSGIVYGVVNDLFATNANLPYFLLGHQPQQKSLLQTNDKIAQGVAWGVAATFGPVVIASVLFTIVATITAFFVPMATFALPVLMLAMPLIAVGAEFYARERTKEHAKTHLDPGSNAYQVLGLQFMSPTIEEKAAWYANSDRNVFGFTKVPFIGLGGLAGLVTLSAVSTYLPAALFASPLIAVFVPAAFAGSAVLTLAACGVYMYANKSTHIDDRNNLEFDREEVVYDLYLDEDQDYANELLLYKNLGGDAPAADSNASPDANKHYGNLFQFSRRFDHKDKAENEHDAENNSSNSNSL